MVSRGREQTRFVFSDVDQAELDAASRLGARRFRRWVNDRILRDMAGRLTAEDMQGLFSPVPFGGDLRKSVIQEASEPHVYALWQSFISIDMDRQDRVLQKWEEHIASQRKSKATAAELGPETWALRTWARVGRKARNAMKRAPDGLVEKLESRILDALRADGGDSGSGSSVDLEVGSSFRRLIVHGIAEYHRLHSSSHTDPKTGARVTRVWRGRGGGGGGSDIRVADILSVLSDISHGRPAREKLCARSGRPEAGSSASEELEPPEEFEEECSMLGGDADDGSWVVL
uniref:Phenazine biosynthesis-like domain-containing protein 1-like n=1 Tax=Tetraselmis sp. GSL018 TaxID=582737 RepID=A0A061RUY1_9CHLO|mmetsp:Transcript_29936/g.71322  ORF Transcript_29936/g.71322 Transcript_29936/m.71322 type:complete len:288 (-) Transcript_29936:118-981(-)